MNTEQLLLIDLSGLAHQLYHVSGNEPDPNFISTQLIARVRALASAHPYAAICCDSGKSFRADLDPTYKAQRDTDNRAVLKHQMDLACETLRRDGFPVWAVQGYEADDLIATAVSEAMAIPDTTVLIASADKDLTQLVSDRVTMKKINGAGELVDPAAVKAKFGVEPSQMHDLLCLMGDKADNIVGANKIGAVIGAKLLTEHGSLVALYDKMAKGVVPGVTPAMRTSLMEFKDRWPLVSSLIALKTDAPIPFAEIAAERVAAPMDEAMEGFIEEEAPAPTTVAERVKGGEASDTTGNTRPNAEPGAAHPHNTPTAAVTLRPAPVEFSQQLEPRSIAEAKQLAQWMFESRLFSAYGTPQAVLSTILAGRELGIPAMASLRAFHIIEGRPTLSAGTIQSLVLKSGKATYFRCTARTNERATFETQRGDDPPVSLTFTVDDGRRAWPKDDAAFAKSGWGKNPADMCVARAATKLARLVYPDVVSGLYAPEEME